MFGGGEGLVQQVGLMGWDAALSTMREEIGVQPKGLLMELIQNYSTTTMEREWNYFAAELA